MKIELLYFGGCPTHKKALEHLRKYQKEYAPDSAIEVIRIESEGKAMQEKFLGSPTIRVQGIDIDPKAGERDDYGLKCRIYEHNDGFSGVPPEEMIIKALKGETQNA